MEGLALQQTYDAVPALKAARETAYTSRMQDVLCALYVAITRAEREQIILAPEKDTKSLKHTAAWLFTSKPPISNGKKPGLTIYSASFSQDIRPQVAARGHAEQPISVRGI